VKLLVTFGLYGLLLLAYPLLFFGIGLFGLTLACMVSLWPLLFPPRG